MGTVKVGGSRYYLLRLRNENAIEIHLGNLRILNVDFGLGIGTLSSEKHNNAASSSSSSGNKESKKGTTENQDTIARILERIVSFCWVNEDSLSHVDFARQVASRGTGKAAKHGHALSAIPPPGTVSAGTTMDWFHAFAARRLMNHTAVAQHFVNQVTKESRLFKQRLQDNPDYQPTRAERYHQSERERVLKELGRNGRVWDDSWTDQREGQKRTLEQQPPIIHPHSAMLELLPNNVAPKCAAPFAYASTAKIPQATPVSAAFLTHQTDIILTPSLRVLRPGQRAAILVAIHPSEDDLIQFIRAKHSLQPKPGPPGGGVDGPVGRLNRDLNAIRNMLSSPLHSTLPFSAEVAYDSSMEPQAFSMKIVAEISMGRKGYPPIELRLHPRLTQKEAKSLNLFPSSGNGEYVEINSVTNEPDPSSPFPSPPPPPSAFDVEGVPRFDNGGNSFRQSLYAINHGSIDDFLLDVKASDPRIIIHDFTAINPNGMPLVSGGLRLPAAALPSTRRKASSDSTNNSSMPTNAVYICDYTIMGNGWDHHTANLPLFAMYGIHEHNYMYGLNHSLSEEEWRGLSSAVKATVDDFRVATHNPLHGVSYPRVLMDALSDLERSVGVWKKVVGSRRHIIRANLTTFWQHAGEISHPLPLIPLRRPRLATHTKLDVGRVTAGMARAEVVRRFKAKRKMNDGSGGEGEDIPSPPYLMIPVHNPSMHHPVEVFLAPPMPLPYSVLIVDSPTPQNWVSIESGGPLGEHFLQTHPSLQRNLSKAALEGRADFPWSLARFHPSFRDRIMLQPGQNASLGPILFTPRSKGSFSGMVVLFNNLTRASFIRLSGAGVEPQVVFVDYPRSPLVHRFALPRPRMIQHRRSAVEALIRYSRDTDADTDGKSADGSAAADEATRPKSRILSALTIDYRSTFVSHPFFRAPPGREDAFDLDSKIAPMLSWLHQTSRIHLLNQTLLFRVLNVGTSEITLRGFRWKDAAASASMDDKATSSMNMQHADDEDYVDEEEDDADEDDDGDADSDGDGDGDGGLVHHDSDDNACMDRIMEYGLQVDGCDVLPIVLPPAASAVFRLRYIPLLNRPISRQQRLAVQIERSSMSVPIRIILPVELQKWLSPPDVGSSSISSSSSPWSSSIAPSSLILGLTSLLAGLLTLALVMSRQSRTRSTVSSSPTAASTDSSRAGTNNGETDGENKDDSSLIEEELPASKKKKKGGKKGKSKTTPHHASNTPRAAGMSNGKAAVQPAEPEPELEPEPESERTHAAESNDEHNSTSPSKSADSLEHGASAHDNITSNGAHPASPNATSPSSSVSAPLSHSMLRKQAKKAARKAAKAVAGQVAQELDQLHKMAQLTPAAQKSLESMYQTNHGKSGGEEHASGDPVQEPPASPSSTSSTSAPTPSSANSRSTRQPTSSRRPKQAFSLSMLEDEDRNKGTTPIWMASDATTPLPHHLATSNATTIVALDNETTVAAAAGGSSTSTSSNLADTFTKSTVSSVTTSIKTQIPSPRIPPPAPTPLIDTQRIHKGNRTSSSSMANKHVSQKGKLSASSSASSSRSSSTRTSGRSTPITPLPQSNAPTSAASAATLSIPSNATSTSSGEKSSRTMSFADAVMGKATVTSDSQPASNTSSTKRGEHSAKGKHHTEKQHALAPDVVTQSKSQVTAPLHPNQRQGKKAEREDKHDVARNQTTEQKVFDAGMSDNAELERTPVLASNPSSNSTIPSSFSLPSSVERSNRVSSRQTMSSTSSAAVPSSHRQLFFQSNATDVESLWHTPPQPQTLSSNSSDPIVPSISTSRRRSLDFLSSFAAPGLFGVSVGSTLFSQAHATATDSSAQRIHDEQQQLLTMNGNENVETLSAARDFSRKASVGVIGGGAVSSGAAAGRTGPPRIITAALGADDPVYSPIEHGHGAGHGHGHGHGAGPTSTHTAPDSLFFTNARHGADATMDGDDEVLLPGHRHRHGTSGGSCLLIGHPQHQPSTQPASASSTAPWSLDEDSRLALSAADYDEMFKFYEAFRQSPVHGAGQAHAHGQPGSASDSTVTSTTTNTNSPTTMDFPAHPHPRRPLHSAGATITPGPGGSSSSSSSGSASGAGTPLRHVKGSASSSANSGGSSTVGSSYERSHGIHPFGLTVPHQWNASSTSGTSIGLTHASAMTNSAHAVNAGTLASGVRVSNGAPTTLTSTSTSASASSTSSPQLPISIPISPAAQLTPFSNTFALTPAVPAPRPLTLPTSPMSMTSTSPSGNVALSSISMRPSSASTSTPTSTSTSSPQLHSQQPLMLLSSLVSTFSTLTPQQMTQLQELLTTANVNGNANASVNAGVNVNVGAHPQMTATDNDASRESSQSQNQSQNQNPSESQRGQ